MRPWLGEDRISSGQHSQITDAERLSYDETQADSCQARFRADEQLLAGRELFVGRPSLSAGQRATAKTLRFEHVKPRLLGHWGTTPGLNFVYVHLNRIIKE
jgi:xylulose-5-phosphate/fructose-6-phosphate phosphoketolase